MEKVLEKVLKNGVQVFSLEVENNFNEAQAILDENEYTEKIDAENAYNDRVSNDFVGTYKVVVQRESDFKRFEQKIQIEKNAHVRSLTQTRMDELSRNRREVAIKYHKGLYESVQKAREALDEIDKELYYLRWEYTCDCKLCSFKVSFEEWKSGKMSNGAKLGKSMRKAGFSQELLDFYSQQIKTEKEVYFTVSDLSQHIAGMSYYCKLGSWDGYKGSSCQDTRHSKDDYPINLGGALHDNKLFIGMLHDKHEDLEDFEDKMLARTLFRLVHIDNEPCLIATSYYGNNETKDILGNAINMLEEANIFGHKVRDGDDGEREWIKENANGAYEMVYVDDVHVCDDYEAFRMVECPACDGSGELEVSGHDVSCPACGGDGEYEASVYVHINEWVEVERTDEILPYVEGYDHNGSYINMYVNVEYIRGKREDFELEGLEEELGDLEIEDIEV